MEKNKRRFSPARIFSTIAVCAFVAVTIFIAIQCSLPKEEEESAVVTPVTQFISLSLNECPLTLDSYANGAVYDAATLSRDKPNRIDIGGYEGYTIYVNDVELQPESGAEFELPQLSLDQKITVKYVEQETGAERVNYINTLPGGFTGYKILSDNPGEGCYYFNLDNYVYKMNTNGEVLYWRVCGGADGVPGGNDFKRTEVDGKVYYSFLYGGGSEEYRFLDGVKYGRMQAFVVDENYRFYDNVAFLVPYEDIGVNCSIENHQFTVLGERHYLLTSYVGKRVYNIPDKVPHASGGVRVTAAVIQEVKDGQVVFHWDSTDYPELYELNPGADYFNKTDYWTDYAHMNSVALDPRDGNLVVSFAKLNTVVKLDCSAGKILWKLGGASDEFGLEETQKFSGQNDVRINADGAITMFNNGVSGEQSTIMKFTLDEGSKAIKSFEEYKCEGTYSPDYGSAQELSKGRYVIGWGERATASSLFSEIDFNTGRTVFEFFRPNYNGSNTYRVYKFAE